ncbi:MAG: DUF1330 domain-containing protein [Chloroflexota bacterium]
MIILTQLVYVHPGKERAFDEFEALAIPLIARHRGHLMLRIRPTQESVVVSKVEVPYEIHVVRFESDDDFTRFAANPERREFLHLRDESVRATLRVKGTEI